MVKYSRKMEEFWGLGRANYLTIPRSVIQEMPVEWQDKFADLLNELDDTIDWRPNSGRYHCMLRDAITGRFMKDPLNDYKHGNQTIIDLFINKEG